MTQEDVLSMIEGAFHNAKRPEHFTIYDHCEECADHDKVLLSRDRTTLSLADVSNPAWNPIDFLTPEGFLYYFPALAKLALSNGGAEFLSMFVPFHLYSALKNESIRHPHRWLSALSQEQCNAILIFARFVASHKRDRVVAQAVNPEELDRAVAFWEAECNK